MQPALTPSQQQAGGSPMRRLLPRNWRVRSKLVAVLVVPAVAFLVLASLNMGGQIASAREYGRGATIAEFGRQVTTLVHDLQGERDLAAGFIAAGRPKTNALVIEKANKTNANLAEGQDPVAVPAPNEGAVLETQQRNVDAGLTSYREAERQLGDVGSQALSRIETARAALGGLGSLRGAVGNQLLTEDAISGQYTGMITTLLDVDREIGQRTGNRELTQGVAGLTALGDLKETLSQERALLYSVASVEDGGRFQFGQFQDLSGAIARRSAALQRFRADATESQRTQYDQLVNGQAVLAVKRLEDTTIGRESRDNLDLNAQQWYAAANTYIQAMRLVEVALLDQVIASARSLRADAQRSAITTGVVIAAILVIAFLTSLLIARSMIGPLKRLRSGALEVAQRRLPEAIERLRSSDAHPVSTDIEPIPIYSRDEIGDVATTFDQLHREAIRLATEQAALRSNVNAMFVNLSRRSQGLVERQLKLIDELETGEQDPDQLANLFKLDHLATRMRRNSENLLVLAGEDAGRRWGRPIPLVDVLRAATSEVEQYHRIQLTGVPDVEVMGNAVNHVVHLVAELLENATVFSSPESKVLVHSQRLSDGGAMVEIEDRGIGMSAQEIADSNERLARPPVFDVSISRMMGLYVVGRLAGRHGITVRLRQAETGGVSAFVRLPVDVLASRFERPEDGAGSPDGRPPRPAALPLPPPGATSVGSIGAGAAAFGPDGSRSQAGPAADLPRRALPGPAGPPLGEPAPAGPPPPGGPAPLPRRTPASANGEGANRNGEGADEAATPTDAGVPRNGLANGSLGARLRTGGVSPGGPGAPDRPGVPGGPGPGQNGGPVAPEGLVGPGQGWPNRAAGNGVPPTIGGATRAPAQPPAAPPRGPVRSAGLPAGSGPYGLPGSPADSREERTPIFEQLQSEWFKHRPPARQPAEAVEPDDAAPATADATPVDARPDRPTGPAPAAAQAPATPVPAAPVAPAAADPWLSPADEGWRAAGRLLQPTSGGTTRAGLPMRVPQAHLVPGGADSAPPPVPSGPPAYRSPEAVRSRLASYHQGVRRGRHADRQDSNGDTERDPSENLVPSQEQS